MLLWSTEWYDLRYSEVHGNVEIEKSACRTMLLWNTEWYKLKYSEVHGNVEVGKSACRTMFLWNTEWCNLKYSEAQLFVSISVVWCYIERSLITAPHVAKPAEKEKITLDHTWWNLQAITKLTLMLMAHSKSDVGFLQPDPRDTNGSTTAYMGARRGLVYTAVTRAGNSVAE